MGLPEGRAKPLGAQALEHHLAVAWFVTMGEAKRKLLDSTALEKLFGQDAPVGLHVLEQDGEKRRVYQVYTPGPDASVKHIVRHLRDRILEARSNDTLAEWIESRQYGFAVLVDNDHKREAVKAALKKSKKGKPLVALAHIHAEVTVSACTLEEVCHEVARSAKAPV